MLLSHVFSDMFDDMLFPATMSAANAPRLMNSEVREYDDHYELNMELAGFKKEDIKAELKDGYLTITAAKGLDKDEQTKQGYVRRERFAGTCSRSFYVGNIRQEDIKGKYEDGVLTLYVPKESKPIEEGPKLIAIE